MRVKAVDQLEGEVDMAASLSSREHIHLKNILVPTDFSAAADNALSYGVALARQFEATLWLVHVVEPQTFFTGLEGVPIPPLDIGEETARAKELMAEFSKNVPANVALRSLVRYGPVMGEISALAKEENLDLVIVSTHGRSGLDRALFGSMAERIVHHAPCPILVVREREHDFVQDSSIPQVGTTIRLNRILAPLDFSDCAKKVVRYAEAFARKFNAGIVCVHVLESEKPPIAVDMEAFYDGHRIEAEKKMAAQLREIEVSVQVEGAIKFGKVHPQIVEMAEGRQVDLIILGERRRSGIGRFLLGSTTDQVIRHAPCPVLVVREVEHEFVE